MPQFQDTTRAPWSIALTVGAIARVKRELAVDLLRLDDEATLHKLVYDPMALAGVLWLLLQAQAEAQGLDEERFAERLDGDAIVAATDALLEAIADFSRPAQRPVLKRAIAKLKEGEAEAAKAAMRAVEEHPTALTSGS